MIVSVIIPMYNAERSIISCLSSVMNQTYKGNIEIIIVNDGSTDKCPEIVRDFILRNTDSSKTLVLLNQVNGGVSKARNKGLNSSCGDFIALLDADDFWVKSKLQLQMDLLASRKDIDFLGCARNNENLSILGRRISSLHKATVIELLIKMFPQTSTVIFKRSLLQKLGGYDETLTHGEDGDLWIRYCANCNFYYLPESLVITGDGKRSFGESGLSADLFRMQRGNELNLSMAKKNRWINFPTFILLYSFYQLKYLRRLIITYTFK